MHAELARDRRAWQSLISSASSPTVWKMSWGNMLQSLCIPLTYPRWDGWGQMDNTKTSPSDSSTIQMWDQTQEGHNPSLWSFQNKCYHVPPTLGGPNLPDSDRHSLHYWEIKDCKTQLGLHGRVSTFYNNVIGLHLRLCWIIFYMQYIYIIFW